MTNVEKFRPGSAIFSGWMLIVFFAGFIIQAIVYGGNIIATTAICSAGILASYLLFLKPYVLIFDEGIKIVNPTKEITASWDLVEEIETKYSMSIIVDGQTFYAWAAPAPSRGHSRRLHKTDLLPGADAPRRLGDSPRSDSGACAYIAKLRRNEFVSETRSECEISTNFVLLYAIVLCLVIGAASIAL
jgi:hypothetical protein